MSEKKDEIEPRKVIALRSFGHGKNHAGASG